MRSRRALVVAPLPPEYDREAGSRAILDMIEFLLGDGWAVSFIAENPRPRGGERYMRMLRQRGVAAYGGFGPRMDELIAEGSFDVAICAFWYIAERLLPKLRVLSPHTRVAVHTIDLHFLRNSRRVFGDGERLDLDYAGEFIRELNVYGACDGVIAVSAKEAELVGDLIGSPSSTFVVPLSDEPLLSPLAFDERHGIVFIGNFRHPPNVEAVRWLIGNVVPALPSGLLDDHPLYIVGNELPESLCRLGEGVSGVRLVGWVPSIVPYVHRSRVSVAPLRHGAGTKQKVIQALSVGTPVVSTSVGLEGLDLRDGQHVLLADTASGFAAAVARVVSERDLWSRLAESGRAAVTASHSRDAASRQFRFLLDTLLARNAKKAAFSEVDRELAERLVKPRYRDLVERVRRVASVAIPPGARVAVVSRGDDELLSLGAADAEHFPGDDSGAWLGWYPANGEEAAAFLDKAVERRVEYLLLPQTATWWLQRYPELAQRLERDWHELLRDDGTCVVYQRRGEQV
jgi:glycosyltransferase involved in cell wall biosynthesis